MSWEAVIGLEVHAQLLTHSKLFCACSTRFGAPPNSHTCEVCLGMPGVLPVLNRRAVELAARAALALGCTVHERSQWARKNYFYPDLPKGYQISQYDQPIATGGQLHIDVDDISKPVGITRIHIEEDAGKTIHDDPSAGGHSCVDFNRGGVPLVEIVSEPDIRSGAEAAAYMKTLRRVLRYLAVCDGNMEQGSLRCDANVSIRPRGETKLGTRTELKNINSFKFVQQAIDFEIDRQQEVIKSGQGVAQETRLWDANKKTTHSMRSKEEAHDYRYFPDPDLPDLVLSQDFLATVRADMPELPSQKRERYQRELALSEYDARVLTEDADVARFFEEALGAHHNPKGLANWVINDLLRTLKDRALDELPFDSHALAELVKLIDDGTISGKIAKTVFVDMMATGEPPRVIIKSKGLEQVSDTESIEPVIDQVIADNPGSAEDFRAGKKKALGFLVGQVMKATRGKANPSLVNELLTKKLSR
ncbi:Asp-tRNA(Asn)/Glu-tRNA(Gln) amidotransferase subunit GatB [Myxococcota bacterium]